MTSNNYINHDLRITIGEVGEMIDKLIKKGTLDKTSKILWATNVDKGSRYELEEDVLPGSILFGLEWTENGETARGTLRIEPPLITSELN
jgi:hypothetical protein